MTYEKLLEEAYKNIQTPKNSGERFNSPKVKGHFEGKKTVLSNFAQIVTQLRRKPEHFQKFLLKELAASGQSDNERLVLNTKVPSSKINEKIEQYVKEFVLCKECKKPDTELNKEGSSRVTFIHCLACGAKHSVRGI